MLISFLYFSLFSFSIFFIENVYSCQRRPFKLKKDILASENAQKTSNFTEVNGRLENILYNNKSDEYQNMTGNIEKHLEIEIVNDKLNVTEEKNTVHIEKVNDKLNVTQERNTIHTGIVNDKLNVTQERIGKKLPDLGIMDIVSEIIKMDIDRNYNVSEDLLEWTISRENATFD